MPPTLAEVAGSLELASLLPSRPSGLLVALVWEGPERRLEVVEGATGTVATLFETSLEPDVVRRRNANEILVSDLGGSGLPPGRYRTRGWWCLMRRMAWR